jgi:hypothetical protein
MQKMRGNCVWYGLQALVICSIISGAFAQQPTIDFLTLETENQPVCEFMDQFNIVSGCAAGSLVGNVSFIFLKSSKYLEQLIFLSSWGGSALFLPENLPKFWSK